MQKAKRSQAASGRPGAPRVWLIDLDDTIMESSGGMLQAIHVRMNDYIARHLSMTYDEAHRLRRRYWSTYGSTFLGLWLHHGIDPRDFLPATHNFDFSPFVHKCGDPGGALKKLPGRKVLFTNGPRNYADAMLSALGLRDFFDDEMTSTDMRLFGRWCPKPNADFFRAACARVHARPGEVCLVDDSPFNLRVAARCGLRTVWCSGYRVRHQKILWRRVYPFVDHEIVHLRDLPRVFAL